VRELVDEGFPTLHCLIVIKIGMLHRLVGTFMEVHNCYPTADRHPSSKPEWNRIVLLATFQAFNLFYKAYAQSDSSNQTLLSERPFTKPLLLPRRRLIVL
jgi:hypothetical protein